MYIRIPEIYFRFLNKLLGLMIFTNDIDTETSETTIVNEDGLVIA